jgi:hypothetical protein
MQILIKRGEFVEQGKLEHIQGIGVGELVYDTDKKGIYTNDGANNMIRIAEVLLAPEGAAYARLPDRQELIPLVLHMPGLLRKHENVHVVLRGYEVDGVSAQSIDSIWLHEHEATSRCKELVLTIEKGSGNWYEVEDYPLSQLPYGEKKV